MDFDLNQFLLNVALLFPTFIFALSIHEYAHALTANWGGDTTSTYQGRLTLNPAAHVDLFGSIIIPLVMLASGGWLFGWARPVPFIETNFRDRAWRVVVALAGPFSNLVLAIGGTIIFSFILRALILGEQAGWWTLSSGFLTVYVTFVKGYVFLNWLLFCFNLLPIPPLDGSHLVYHFLIRGRMHLEGAWEAFSRFGFFALILILLLTPVGTLLGLVTLWLTDLTGSLIGFPGGF